MNVRQAYRYELKPNAAQRVLLAKHAGVARYAYNWGLARRKELLSTSEGKARFSDAIQDHRAWNEWKRTSFPWWEEVSKCAPQEAFRDLDRAFKIFWAARKEGRSVGFPRFHKKGRHDAFRFSTGAIRALGSHAQLPRLGRIRVKERTAVKGRILSATVSREADRWFVSFTVERERPDPKPVEGDIIGVDLGVAHFATVSDGDVLEAPRPLARHLKKLKRLQRQHSRKQKGSSNRRKSATHLARLHRRIRNIRQDFLHKATTRLAKTKRVIVVESLAIRNLTRSARGTTASPGKRVRQKAGLNRSILDQGWGLFLWMLVYKTFWYGSKLLQAAPYYASSKTCSSCGAYRAELPLAVRRWRCEACGVEHDRDRNAAINLANLARSTESSSGTYACRDPSGGGTDTRPVYEPRVVEAGSERAVSAAETP